MSNKTYDLLKNIALIFPLITTLVITVMKIWNIPYAVEVGLTLAAINTFIASIVKISNDNYNKEVKKNDIHTKKYKTVRK